MASALALPTESRSTALAAVLRKIICGELGNPVDADAVNLGGLLHDVGKPLVGVMLLEAEKVIGKGFKVAPTTWAETIELSHRKVGVELARSWSLGDELLGLDWRVVHQLPERLDIKLAASA